MFSRRIAMAMLFAMLIAALTVAPAAAAKPSKPPPTQLEERPLTPEEEAQSDAKVAAANAYLAGVAASGADLATLNCVTPTASTTESTIGGTDSSTDGATIDACYVPQGFVTVYARDQIHGHYCGPAVGQVIANYTWAMASTANRYSQGTIAGWMATDVNGQTTAEWMEAGLEKATAGGSRRPANWNWVITNVRDYNGNGDTADEVFSYLRSNVSGSKMPLAIPVKPHASGATYWLASWPRAVASVGHWIAAYGWVGVYSGTSYSRLYFTDSSKDEGGSTGKFYNSVLSIAWMISRHTGRLVW